MNTWALDVELNNSVRDGVDIILRDGQGGEEVKARNIQPGSTQKSAYYQHVHNACHRAFELNGCDWYLAHNASNSLAPMFLNDRSMCGEPLTIELAKSLGTMRAKGRLFVEWGHHTNEEARPYRLRNGSWGYRVFKRDVSPGDEFTVRTRDGSEFPIIVIRILSQGLSGALVVGRKLRLD